MDITKYKDTVLRWFNEWFSRNYDSGVPKIPPHTHNGIDNLSIRTSDLSGNLVTSIVAGTNVTISPTTGVGAVTVNASGGGGGGSPGGVDTNVQFNDATAFGGDNAFDWDKTNKKLILDDASGGGGVGGDIITGGDSDLKILTNDKSASFSKTGVLHLKTGDAVLDDSTTGYIDILTGIVKDTYSTSGDINIRTGNADLVSTSSSSTGSVYIKTGTSYSGGAGAITLTAGSSTEEYGGGGISITAGDGSHGSGTVSQGGVVSITAGKAGNTGTSAYGGYVTLSGSRDINASSQGATFTVQAGDRSGNGNGDVIAFPGQNNLGRGVFLVSIGNLVLGSMTGFTRSNGPILYFTDISSDPSAPTGGGALYTKAGALYYRGSGGTVTAVAPA